MTSTTRKTGLSDALSGFFEEEAKSDFASAGQRGSTPDDELNHPKGANSIVPVFVPVPANKPYSYSVGEGDEVVPGSIVRVPIGPRTVVGIVWHGEGDEGIERKKLRTIQQVYDGPPISHTIRRFIEWVARYTMTSPGLIARMVAPISNAFEGNKPTFGLRATGQTLKRQTPARSRVLDLAKSGASFSKSALAKEAGVSSSVIDGLIKQGALERVPLPPRPLADKLNPDHNPAKLFEGQSKAAEIVRGAVNADKYSVTLVDGVTGSGKTEVYFEAIAEALRANKQVLVLVPEISLTSAFLDRFADRFGGRPTEWHSGLTPKQRERVWRGVSNGEVKVVIGARSALFLPLNTLGLIVIDEEHDAAYKQEDRAIYNARDMAVVRGHLGDFPVLLASATPSLESFINAREGRYKTASLPDRIGAAEMPDIKPIDMRAQGPEKGHWLAPELIEAMRETLDKGEQSLLFLNRRGYAPLTLCRECGYRFQCPDCSTWLVEHRMRNTIECHHCGYVARKPNQCPNCDGQDTLVACGPGVERIHEEVAELFPNARSIVLASDMFSTTERLKQELAAIERGEADIVIGTQLVAKGHNFPKLALVGVIDADLGLAHGDMRAAERTFQMLSQVTGRAGRAGGKSSAYLQTYAPDHVVMKALIAGDRNAFYEAEANERHQAGLPPYGRLVSFIISGKDKASAIQHAQHLRATAPGDPRIMVLGPSEAPLAVIRARHRVRLLIQAPKTLDIQSYIQNWLAHSNPARGGVQMQIDVDPQSFW